MNVYITGRHPLWSTVIGFGPPNNRCLIRSCYFVIKHWQCKKSRMYSIDCMEEEEEEQEEDDDDNDDDDYDDGDGFCMYFSIEMQIDRCLSYCDIHFKSSDSQQKVPTQQNLVGGLEHDFYCPIYIGKVLIPIDELIFFRGL